MELLIRAIIAIFEAIFDEDAKRRRQPTPAPKPRPAPAKPGSAGQVRTDVLEKLRREMAEAARQARQAEARGAEDQQEGALDLVLEEENPALPAVPLSAIQAFDPQALAKPMAASAVQARASKEFVLPGKSDLERMIWAQVIFSPPPALRRCRIPRF
jgi:hypothetical protein